uniref:FYVE-type domain-containing protein n=1 Tax=Kwoniella bestiolae CBS 10118 TaxID=1296100 RepID=A0A1B9FSY6_9TREE|nr:hypothetical protein I302_08665 [Kwoniella bestiolae CBS 10118]OCF21886.1 hypothetical protein I302_08665 [Kwoniella bestiolae CBS 10118]
MESQRPARIPPPGLPILSGPPPVIESSNCRQCSKEFNFLFRRKHVCGHCGYEYCSNCISDGQALMPRRAGQASSSSSSSNSNGPASIFNEIKEGLKEGLGLDEKSNNVGSGYEVESVCLPCLGMLQVTAANLTQLRALPIKRLKEYLAAYNIPCVGPKEKEDFVQAVIRARNPNTGCLSHEAESYYRRRSVPKSGQPSSQSSTPTPTPRARPPPPQQARPPPQTYYRPPPPQNHYRPPPPQNTYRPPPPAQPTPRPPQQARPVTSTPKPQASPAPPPPPVPTILSLVSLPKSYLSSLSIGTLKAILYENHVRVDFKQVLEKEQLIDRVNELIVDERKRLERQRIEEERLAAGLSASAPVINGNSPSAENKEEEEGEKTEEEMKTKVPTGPMPEIDRGLCVVCQDEEATLAVVDCGLLGSDHGYKSGMSVVQNENSYVTTSNKNL